MKKAEVNGKLVVAGPDAPDAAVRLDCGGKVRKRQCKLMDGGVTYFYRHNRGQGTDCPRRYRPT